MGSFIFRVPLFFFLYPPPPPLCNFWKILLVCWGGGMGWGGGCGTAEALYIFGPWCYKHRFTRQSGEKTTFPNKITRQHLEDKQSPPRRCRAAWAQDVILRAVCFLAAGSQRRSRRSMKKKKPQQDDKARSALEMSPLQTAFMHPKRNQDSYSAAERCRFSKRRRLQGSSCSCERRPGSLYKTGLGIVSIVRFSKLRLVLEIAASN